MVNKETKEAAAKQHMGRQIIHVECLLDQAGIAAALRRAFAAGSRDQDSDRQFDDLLRQLH
jgi:hypothetical protein